MQSNIRSNRLTILNWKVNRNVYTLHYTIYAPLIYICTKLTLTQLTLIPGRSLDCPVFVF